MRAARPRSAPPARRWPARSAISINLVRRDLGRGRPATTPTRRPTTPGRLTAIDISNSGEPGRSPGTSAVGELAAERFNSQHRRRVRVRGQQEPQRQQPSSNDDGTGNSLTILDISTNPAQPTIVGSVHDSDESVRRLRRRRLGALRLRCRAGPAQRPADCPRTPASGTRSMSSTSSNPANPTIVATLDNGSLPAPWTGKNLLQHATRSPSPATTPT